MINVPAVNHYQAYRTLVKEIPTEAINIVVELGSRDAKDAVWLQEYFNADIISWECNPKAIELCRDVIKTKDRIKLVEKAVWSSNTRLKFKPVVSATDSMGRVYENIGASSVYDSNPEYIYETFKQEEIWVEAERLDSWWGRHMGSQPIDLLFMDLQGAELEALKGADNLLKDVKYIITEGFFKECYHTAPLIGEIEEFLITYGFRKVHTHVVNDWFGDFMFIKEGIQ
tara:strand:+ start:776 stop:1459 length:684 start_codon:yes stop_codon:yes gene_type:complete